MRNRTIRALGLTAMLAVAAACAGGEEAAEDHGDMDAAAQAPAPDTTAAALWAHLEGASYQDWPRWPETSALYQGNEPHGMLLTTYVNGAAQEALAGGAAAMPAGAIVVKENYMPDSTLAAVTVMFKADGFDPDNNNWFWLKRNADGTVDVQGRGTGCINCHGARRDNDFLYTSSLGGM